MLRLRVTIERQPRTKNGQPAHNTTGVDSANCSQLDSVWSIQGCVPKRCAPISSIKTGAVSTTPIHKRLVMSTSSGLGPASAVARSGSSAIPQIGQAPSPTLAYLRAHRAGVDRACGNGCFDAGVGRQIFFGIGGELGRGSRPSRSSRVGPDGCADAAWCADPPSCRRPDRQRWGGIFFWRKGVGSRRPPVVKPVL